MSHPITDYAEHVSDITTVITFAKNEIFLFKSEITFVKSEIICSAKVNTFTKFEINRSAKVNTLVKFEINCSAKVIKLAKFEINRSTKVISLVKSEVSHFTDRNSYFANIFWSASVTGSVKTKKECSLSRSLSLCFLFPLPVLESHTPVNRQTHSTSAASQ
ncbi:MAG: hypothetical protein V2A54_06945 [Bacteroidota bacterium]